MNMNDFPRMLYKYPGTEEIHGARYATKIVNDEDELDDALADGWKLSTAEAKEAADHVRPKATVTLEVPVGADPDPIPSEMPVQDPTPESDPIASSDLLVQSAAQNRLETPNSTEYAAHDGNAVEPRLPYPEDAGADLESLTRDELKNLATDLGIIYAKNVPAEKLRELIVSKRAGGTIPSDEV